MDVDDALCFGIKMRGLWQQGISCCIGICSKHLIESNASNAYATAPQEMSSGLVLDLLVVDIHRFIKNSSRFNRTLPTTVRAASFELFSPFIF